MLICPGECTIELKIVSFINLLTTLFFLLADVTFIFHLPENKISFVLQGNILLMIYLRIV